MMKDSKLMRISIIVGIFLSVVMIANTALSTYVLYTTSFTASMGEQGETLDIAINTDTGRLTLIERILDTAKDWVGTYYVGGSEAANSTTGITISVTGSNVASQASVSYYIEGVASDASGNPYRFLAGNGTAITVGGASVAPTNQTTVEEHLEAMGLSTDASHTIDYYVYVVAQATGAVSGDTLTSEIVKTKFDTVTYGYGSVAYELIGQTGYDGEVFCGGSMQLGQGTAGTGYIPVHNGTIYRIYMKARRNDGGAASVCGTVYEWTSGSGIGDLIAQSDLCTGAVTGSWTTVNGGFTAAGDVPIYTNQEYWFGGWFEKDGSNTDWKLRYQSSTSGWYFYNSEYRAGLSAPDPMSGGSIQTARTPAIYIQNKYIGYAASWYDLPPLSVVSMPMAWDVAAVLAVIVAALLIIRKRQERRK